MYISENTIDDLMIEVFNNLIELPFNIKASKGTTSELFGVLLELKNPRARLSLSETRGKPFSALGELLWYLSGDNSNEFIDYYIKDYSKCSSDDSKTIRGGYGSRFFNMRGEFNQIENVISLLKRKKTSRRATIQLFDASDLEKDFKDIPCTCSIQLIIRENKLNMFTSMRSNDAYLGLPHDIFCFTMIQEILARILEVDLGTYKHAVASLHLYDVHENKVKEYLEEGYHSVERSEMPRMPKENVWNNLEKLKIAEKEIRAGNDFDILDLKINNYWLDLTKLLKIHSLKNEKENSNILKIRDSLSSNVYHQYIDKKLNIKKA